MKETSSDTNHNNIEALIMALPILSSSLDEETKEKIKKKIDGMETGAITAMGGDANSPNAQMFKETIKTVRFLLNSK